MFSDYLEEYFTEDEKDEIPQQILQKAIQDKIIYNDAIAAGYELSSEDVEEIESMFSDEEYIAYFETMKISISELKEVYKRDYIIEEYIEAIGEEEIDALYDDFMNTKNVKINNRNLNNYLNKN